MNVIDIWTLSNISEDYLERFQSIKYAVRLLWPELAYALDDFAMNSEYPSWVIRNIETKAILSLGGTLFSNEESDWDFFPTKDLANEYIYSYGLQLICKAEKIKKNKDKGLKGDA